LADGERHQAAHKRFRQQLSDVHIDGFCGQVHVFVTLLQRQPAAGLAFRQEPAFNENLRQPLAGALLLFQRLGQLRLGNDGRFQEQFSQTLGRTR